MLEGRPNFKFANQKIYFDNCFINEEELIKF